MADNLLGRVRYLPAFDGVRALCITAVIAFHVISTDHPWLENIARRGWCGVDVFFVLSGFLITWIVTFELDQSGTVDLPRFYGRRALRLQPAFFSGLFGTMMLLLVVHRAKYYTMIHALPYFLTYTYNFAVALGIIGFTLYGQVWSLCIEEHFYLFWPWVLRRLGSRKSLRFALAAIVFVLLYRSVLYGWLNWGHLAVPSMSSLDRIYYGTDTRIDTILVGCATALALREPSLVGFFRRVAEWRWLTLTVIAIGLVAFGWATGGSFKGGWRSSTVGFTLIALASAGVILALYLKPDSLLSRCLAWKPAVFVGKISYGIYLFHDPLWNGLARAMGLRSGRQGTLLQEACAFVLVFLGSVAVAWLHFVLVEKRFLAWRDRLDSRRRIRLGNPLPVTAGRS